MEDLEPLLYTDQLENHPRPGFELTDGEPEPPSTTFAQIVWVLVLVMWASFYPSTIIYFEDCSEYRKRLKCTCRRNKTQEIGGHVADQVPRFGNSRGRIDRNNNGQRANGGGIEAFWGTPPRQRPTESRRLRQLRQLQQRPTNCTT